MKKASITSAVVFPKLRNILEEDIGVLNRMSERSNDSDMSDQLNSLVDAKKKILSLFPSNEEGIGGAATPPQRLHIVGYESTPGEDISNLSSMLYKIECDQMEFVKDNVSDEGMPDELEEVLKEILGIYQKITDQLGRSQKTNQANTIVI